MVLLTYDQTKGVTKGCLSPGQAVVWQVNVLGCAIYVTASNPSGFKTGRRKEKGEVFIKDNRLPFSVEKVNKLTMSRHKITVKCKNHAYVTLEELESIDT